MCLRLTLSLLVHRFKSLWSSKKTRTSNLHFRFTRIKRFHRVRLLTPKDLRSHNIHSPNFLTYQSVVQLKAVQAAGLNMARAEFAEQPVLKSWSKLLQYLKAHMGHETKEQFRIVFLNTKNAVTADEVQQHGTVNHTPVYPREVIKRALDLGATALIMVHNHPSGDPTPSQADIDMTTEVMEAGERLGIMLHDHIIISKHGHSSFK